MFSEFYHRIKMGINFSKGALPSNASTQRILIVWVALSIV
jgi:hypothetical protein